jgi:hypothetical protein
MRETMLMEAQLLEFLTSIQYEPERSASSSSCFMDDKITRQTNLVPISQQMGGPYSWPGNGKDQRQGFLFA